ncbi:MAG: TRAP transporter small permease subunit [Deltaproteobacteria bacterium]|nr:TRAP transporter small permease subunit [Deltaproteobacteria bacterium]MBW2122878.1 TRAP transporter small permease subunit [Deltaproteobacteria bacterium]
MGKLINVIENVIDHVQIVLLCSIVGAIGAQIFSRTLFNRPLEFPEELSMFTLIAIVILGIVVVEKEDAHIKVEFFYERMPRTAKKSVRVLGKILTFILVLAILDGEKQLFPRIIHLKTKAARIPYLWIHAIIVVACILWLVMIAYTLFQILKGQES